MLCLPVHRLKSYLGVWGFSSVEYALRHWNNMESACNELVEGLEGEDLAASGEQKFPHVFAEYPEGWTHHLIRAVPS